jgi:phage shock protein C
MPQNRLMRSTSDRILAGVCGGLASYLGIDTILVRLAFLLLIPASGLGPLIYLILWLLMPEEGAGDQSAGDIVQENLNQMGETVSASAQRFGDHSQGPTLLAIVFILLGLYFLLQNAGWFGGAMLGPLLLVALGIYVLMRRRR